ncbi:hypothetical protein CBR_g57647 [Chara braunii]|uniref:CCHC-type domain-containing protein n=1 Tax=Chara braunii TaxID=69332 RepID=A0A388MEH1_CHABU|nr:hypothetical protein CBR_g57647 [Chara braunii]|eukprot:GBG92889.1 hypothetical protein CBR_g57647 [Chara braunii]
MYLTTGPANGNGGNGGGTRNYGGNNFAAQGNPVGRGYGGYGGAGGTGGPSGRCYNCGKSGHYARDCWAKRGRPTYQNQPYPEIEEMKEQFRLVRKEKQEQKERGRDEEERKAKEEEENRRNLDFARKMEELKLQLRIDLNEEWKKKNQAAEEAVARSRKREKRGRPRTGGRRGKKTTTMKECTPIGYERGECSKKLPPEGWGSKLREGARTVDEQHKDMEPKTPLSDGYKELSAGCSQKGLIEYCMSTHKIYSEKKANTLRRICEKRGIKYTKKPEIVELLAKQQVQLAYEGFDETKMEEDVKGKGKATETPRKETVKDKVVLETSESR